MDVGLLALASALPAAFQMLAGKPWLWSLVGALAGAVVVGSIATVATLLWAKGVRKVWNAPELSEGFFRRLAQLPSRMRAWALGRSPQMGRLDDIWHKFEAQLPPAVRAQLLDIPTVVLFGGQRAGKTALIDAYIDWSSMQGQFMPSLRDENLPLRISLGSRVLVEELADSILESDAPATASDLTQLWRPLSQFQQPLIIMAIDVNRLSPERMQNSAAAAALVSEARMLVGKVALLSRLCGGQLKVRICLTHMDNVPGFSSLERFCNALHVPLRVALQAAHSRTGGASDLLALYRRYLPLALIRSKPEDYAGIVRFLHDMPSRLRALEPYFEELVRDPTRRLTPTLDRLYFFSNQGKRSDENPFLRSTGPERRRSRGLRAWFTRVLHGQRHLLIAAACTLAALSVFGIGFLIDGSRVENVDRQLVQLSHAVKRTAGSHNPPYASSELHALLTETGRQLHELEKHDDHFFLYRLLRQKRKHQAAELFVKAVRDSQFLPLLERFKDRQREDLILFTLAALHGTANNGLGGLVIPHLGEWAKKLELPPHIISDYLHFSDQPYEGRAHINGLFAHSSTLLTGLGEPHVWYEQMVGLEKYFAARSLEPADLARLRDQLRPFLQVVDGVGKVPLVGQVYRVLSEVAPWSVSDIQGARGFSLAPPAWLLDQLTQFHGLLHLACGTEGDRTAAPQNFYQALRLLVDGDGGKAIPDEVFVIELEGRQFSFSARQWLELLRRSRKGQVMRSLFNKGDGAAPNKDAKGDKKEKRHHRHSHGHHKKSDPSEVSYSDDSKEKDSPQDLYSPEVLRRDILPILKDLDKKLEQRSSLSPDQRKALERYVSRESQRYASAYCDDLRKQYNHFSFAAFGSSARIETTLGLLRGLLQKDGALVAHLKALNAGVDVGQLEGPYLEPLRQCLVPLQPVARLAVPDKDGNLPELKPYGELIADLIKQLEAPPAKVAEDGKKIELKDALSPAGRISLAALTGQPENMRQRFVRVLQERQIPESLQGPLISPLRHVLGLGDSDLRRTLANQWEQGPRNQLSSLFDLYPFRRDATRDATPTDLDVIKPQQGSFWLAFLPIFEPVCMHQGGRWRPRTQPGGTVPLPADLLSLVNRAEEVSHRLFSADGKTQSLSLQAKASPPAGLPASEIAVRSFLISGKSGHSVFMPNGVSAQQVLPIDWTQPAVAAVGVETQVGGGAPQTQSIDGPESHWSLFRLLERASLNGKLATWRLPRGSTGTDDADPKITFTFNVEPFSLFQGIRRSEDDR